MNLLLINYEYPPVGGGAATATQAIARALAAQGHSPHVLTARFGDQPAESEEQDVRIHRIPARRRRIEACSILEMGSFVASALLRIRSLVRRHRIGGVIAFFSFPCGPVARWSDRPYVVSLRGGDVPGAEPGLARMHALLAPLRRLILRDACAVVANSAGLSAMSEAADPVPVQVIPNGVDTTLFRPGPGPAASGTLRLLFVGRFQAQKNLSWLLRQLAGSSVPPFSLTLVGDGPLRAELQAEAASLGLSPHLEWLGWQSREQLAALYPRHDVLVNPSLYEGMPNVVLEAMACGLPVVASRVPGNDTLVHDGVNGFLFPLSDAPAFASALTKLATADRRAPLGRNALATAESFSWASVASRYAALFA
jgi:glycosyltransferase involved in cell wall biosynthesis